MENNGAGLNLTFEVRDGILHHKRSGTPATMEGKVVSIADRIAYLNHDIDDAVRAGVISESDLRARINTMIYDVVEQSMDRPDVQMSDAVAEQFQKLREFMFARVYYNPVAKSEAGKAKRVVEQLFE